MIHNDASIEDVVRMAYNTPTYAYGYKLAAADHPPCLTGLVSLSVGSESTFTVSLMVAATRPRGPGRGCRRR
jgi:hypothetical protein